MNLDQFDPVTKAASSRDKSSLTEHVYDVISEMLMSGALRPGDRMSQRSLAEQLGVSVMPIRAAIGRLAARGALVVEPKRAIKVPILTRTEFRDLSMNRIQMECWAIKLAARNGMSSVPLRSAEQIFRNALSRDDTREAVRSNKALHFQVYAGAKSPVLLELVTIMWLKAGPLINLDLGEQSRTTRHAASVKWHARFVDAVLRGDEEAAAYALGQDIQSATDFILSRNILPD